SDNYNCSVNSRGQTFQSESTQSEISHNGGGGWAPERTDRLRWLQVDLRERVEVTTVATQGRFGSPDWVTSYMLLYSDTGRAWKQFRQEDNIGTFPGNTNSDGTVHHKLSHSIRTRFLRFLPVDWSPGGWMGLRVEVYGCAYKSDVADFNGRSSLLYRFNQKSTSTVKDVISLRFKSQRADGVLVHGEGQRGDYITLELHKGRLSLHINLDDAKMHPSSGHVSVFLGSLLDDQHWHSVLIERFNKQINFTVDRLTKHVRTGGLDDSLEVDYEGNVTFTCSEPQLVSATFLSSSSSFLSLPLDAATETLSVTFQFQTWNREGMLLSAWLRRESERLLLLLVHGQLRLTHHRSALQSSDIVIGQALSDGQWHTVSISMGGFQVSLSVDDKPPSTMQLKDIAQPGRSLVIGGCPSVLTNQGCRNPTMAYQGCMRSVIINNQPINFYLVQQGLLGNYSKLQFDICGIRDRCLPNYCEHDGECSQSWNTFFCDCSGTGYTGATCHNSIFEPSCEAHRLTGSASGFFSIDPDGSGPLKSTVVYCNITGETSVWTVVNHNSTEMVRVQGSSLQKPHVMKFNYSASLEQLRTLVSKSEQCQQEVVYLCRKSRLFNTWDGTPLSWWLDRAGERRTYWGGFLPGVQQCACSLDENCIDMNHFCNCDADRSSWYEENDTGVLSYKEHLPVTEILIGDTNRSGSEAIYRVGSLHCYGDRFLWNAASFYQESSYLHFPTLQAELSVDISLYFKTTAPSGVFLEHLGTKDFIRVELSAPSVVTFTFDVGNGPVVLTVKSHVPLNDKQWHYVRAERNVKEASLQVDQLPLRFLEAPSEGHTHLQLNSQLFIGGTASRQRGFLGCIRSLNINGMTLDLEERAKMTPGVSSGCPGHCSSQNSLCHNRGKCIEKSSGYVCDCTHSAYGGPNCKKEVSVSFESGSSVTYTFQEPFSVMRNHSRQSSAIFAQSSNSRESIAFSFLTTQTPAMLLTVNTYHQQYMAIILAHNGSLQIWYRLNRDKEPDIFTPMSLNLANGELHRVQIHREGRDMYVQVSFACVSSLTLGRAGVDEEVLQAGSRGFIGCLSSVQFNHLAPLKASWLISLHPDLCQVGKSTILCFQEMVKLMESVHNQHILFTDHADTGSRGKKLTNAAQSDSAVIGGLIAAVVLITLCALGVMTRFLYRHRHERTRQMASVKEKDHQPRPELRYRAELDLHSAMRDSRKEYFI
uniref:Contactin associated protein-like 5b n=1 Tax=Cyprinus carpio carpio TaxID=630221 RepID=A0A9J7YM77_CYPCA